VVALFRKPPPSGTLEQAGLAVLTSELEPTR